MTALPEDRSPRRRATALVIAAIGLAAAMAVVVFLLASGGDDERGRVEVRNEPTRAREVGPLTTDPDPRFDPYPIERERKGEEQPEPRPASG